MKDVLDQEAKATAVFRVVIADDDDQVREGLAALIDDHPQLEVVGQAANGVAAAELCAEHHPELAVVDVMMSGGGEMGPLAISYASPETVVVAYTARSDRRTRARLLAAGAAEVFVKGGGSDLAAEFFELAQRAGATTPEPPPTH